MKIKYLLLLLLLIPLALASEEDICEKKLEVGQNCTMLTPSINCQTYNHTIFNQTNFVREGNLTILNNSIYFFIFNESQGDYIVKLCDGSTREIIVEVKDQMLSIVIGIIIVILAFAAFGHHYGRNEIGLKFLCYTMSFAEIVVLVFMLWMKETGGSLVSMLRINFWVVFLIVIGIGFIALTRLFMRALNLDDSMEDNDKKWQGRK